MTPATSRMFSTLRAFRTPSTRLRTHPHVSVRASLSHPRNMSTKPNPLDRPSPPPLPRADQREFEELVRKAQAPLPHASRSVGRDQAEAELALHPDARQPLRAEFEGEVNPATGEQGGPKREPVGRWGEGSGHEDWSFKGRVSDF